LRRAGQQQDIRRVMVIAEKSGLEIPPPRGGLNAPRLSQ
jgi:hypothetical protein